MKKLLIVDDELGSRESLKAVFSREYASTAATNAGEALDRLAAEPFDVMLVDVVMPGRDGLSLLKEVQSLYPAMPCIMVSASSSLRPVVDAIKAGAIDYIAKPYDVEEIRLVVRRAIESSALKRRLEVLQNEAARNNPTGAVGHSVPFLKVLDAARMAANTDATVFITGESGTGKELIARMIHSLSSRREEPFVALHCGSLPETLMESELFGHEKGAFTGADKRKPGRFDLAGSGTLFFDEVTEMSPATQGKLLRVLQEREYMRVGGTQVIRTNARIVAACNKDPKKEMLAKRFREDLFYRLNVVPIHVPSLRERPDDIAILARYFLGHFRQSMNILTGDFTPDALRLLNRYDWPGNVRELRNVIERILVLHGSQPIISDAHLPEEFRPHPATAAVENPAATESPPASNPKLEDAVNAYERALVLDALKKANGIQTRAAEILGTTRRILKYRMDKLGLTDSTAEETSAPP